MQSIIIYLILLALTEAILKPVVTRLTQLGIRRYLVPAYSKLDELLTIPSNWQAFVNDAESFILEAIIPDEVPTPVAEQVATYLVKNFDLPTFLGKLK